MIPPAKDGEREGAMGAALTIRDDLTPEALRRRARHEPSRRAALRLLAIANALEGMSRAEAARLAGMERQALRDAVVRYNAEGLAGLHDRPKPGRPQRLSEAEQAALAAPVFAEPDPERDGASAWTRADLGAWLARRFGKAFHPPACRGCSGAWACRGRRCGRSTPRPTRRPRNASEKGAARRPEGGRRSASRQARRALVHGRGARGSEGPALPSLVGSGPASAGAVRPALRMGLHLRRRRARHRGGGGARPAGGDHGGDEPVPGRVRRRAARGRARGPGRRRRRLARLPRPGRPGQRHAGPAAALLAGVEPGRAGLAVPARALPVAAGVRRLPSHRRRLLRGLEPARRRAGPPPFPVRPALDQEGQFIGSAVLHKPGIPQMSSIVTEKLLFLRLLVKRNAYLAADPSRREPLGPA